MLNLSYDQVLFNTLIMGFSFCEVLWGLSQHIVVSRPQLFTSLKPHNPVLFAEIRCFPYMQIQVCWECNLDGPRALGPKFHSVIGFTAPLQSRTCAVFTLPMHSQWHGLVSTSANSSLSWLPGCCCSKKPRCLQCFRRILILECRNLVGCQIFFESVTL